MPDLSTFRTSEPLYRSVWILAAFLVIVDLVLLVLHCVRVVDPSLLGPAFSIESDRGLAEYFQYVKELAIMILLIMLALRFGMKGLFSWAALFLYVIVDDAFSVHEVVGARLAEVFQFIPEHLKPRDVGELIVSAAAGGVLFAFIGLSYWFSDSRFRAITHDLVLLFAGLAFFGVFVDALHSAIHLGGVVSQILGLAEDGGEMVAMTLILIYTWSLWSVPAEKCFHPVDSAWRFLRERFFLNAPLPTASALVFIRCRCQNPTLYSEQGSAPKPPGDSPRLKATKWY